MVEIIPNWHPIFVHFTVALFSISVAFYTLSYLFTVFRIHSTFAADFEVVARWCVWIAGIAVIATFLAGLQAYNTVNHDAPSHLAMKDHRNWAIPTAISIVLTALWALWRAYKHQALTFSFIVALCIVQGLLLSTAWRGAELVFRYGLGVMSLPQAEGEGHSHDHAHEMGKQMDHSIMPAMKNKQRNNHQHDHRE